MNERIRELEAQCWEPRKHPASQAALGDKFNTEKFAELIVRECIRLCDQVDIVGADECIDNIKEHFGVKNETR